MTQIDVLKKAISGEKERSRLKLEEERNRSEIAAYYKRVEEIRKAEAAKAEKKRIYD